MYLSRHPGEMQRSHFRSLMHLLPCVREGGAVCGARGAPSLSAPRAFGEAFSPLRSHTGSSTGSPRKRTPSSKTGTPPSLRSFFNCFYFII